MAEAIRVSFTLTRLQRILNPPERLLWTLLGAVAFVCGMLPALVAPESLRHWVLLGLVVPWTWLALRNPLRTLVDDLVGTDYVDTLVIDADSVLFGVHKPESRLARGVKVGRGLCGVIILRHPLGYVIRLPRAAMTVARVKEVIAGSCMDRG